MTPTNITVTIGQFERGYPVVINTEDGPIEGWHQELVWLAAAQSNEGHRWVGADFLTEDEVKAWVALHPTPAGDDLWFQEQPIYGSDAWGSEDEYELACFEADAYGEPRPRW